MKLDKNAFFSNKESFINRFCEFVDQYLKKRKKNQLIESKIVSGFYCFIELNE